MNTTLRKLLAFSLVAIGIFCFLKGLPSSVTRDAANGVMPGAVASMHSDRPALPAAASVKTRAIQDIRVGQRVLAKNPEISNLERRTRRAEPDFGRWLQLSLEMPKSDGSTLHIEMLRSEEWLRNQIGFVIGEIPDPAGERLGVSPPSAIPMATPTASVTPDLNPPSPKTENLQPKTELAPLSPLRPIFSEIVFASIAAEAEDVELVGLTVDLDLPEMGACGTAVIRGISTTPEIEQGEGQVVTATFRHPPSNTVLDVVFVDEGTSLDQHGLATAADPAASAEVVTAQSTQTETASKPIGVTDNHLFWSEDRGEFIEIGRMEIGERVRTLFGETKILAQKLPRPGPPAEVYNLEVHEEHVYFVGDDGVLAHNSCDDDIVLGYDKLYHGRGMISSKPHTVAQNGFEAFKSLDSFHSAVGGKNYWQWAGQQARLGDNLPSNLRKFIDDSGGTIRFNLDGFRNKRSDLARILIDGASDSGRRTHIELVHVLRNHLDRTEFYRNGSKIDPRSFFGEQLLESVQR